MKKLLALLLSLILVLGVFTACTTTDAPETEKDPVTENVETPEEPKVAELTKVVALKGPTGMGMAKLITDADAKYSFELTSMPDDVTSSLISGTVIFFFMFVPPWYMVI